MFRRSMEEAVMILRIILIFLIFDLMLSVHSLPRKTISRDLVSSDIKEVSAAQGSEAMYMVCTTDQDCETNGKCLFLICVHTCQTDVQCSSQEICNRKLAACVPKLLRKRYTKHCNEKNRCLFHEVCLHGKCVSKAVLRFPCVHSKQCHANEKCEHGYCKVVVCSNDMDCFEGWHCEGGTCMENSKRDIDRCHGHACKICSGNTDCATSESCVNSHCETFSSLHHCRKDKPCGNAMKCFFGRCVHVSCLLSTDCPTGENCVEGICKEAKCSYDKNCLMNEYCIRYRCVTLEDATLKNLCEKHRHCLENEECVDGKCSQRSLHNKKNKVLPGNFICDCKEDEDCDIRACHGDLNRKDKGTGINEIVGGSFDGISNTVYSSAPPAIEGEVTHTRDLKQIIKELIKEEENNILNEIDKKQTQQDQIHKRNEDANKMTSHQVNQDHEKIRSHSAIVHGNQDFQDLLEDREEDFNASVSHFLKRQIPINDSNPSYSGHNCVANNECGSKECCVLGVCLPTKVRTRVSATQRQYESVNDLNVTGVECINDAQCLTGLSCSQGWCKERRTVLKKSHLNSECSENLHCKGARNTCFFGKCVEMVNVRDDKMIIPCVFGKGHETGHCLDEGRTCWENACVLL